MTVLSPGRQAARRTHRLGAPEVGRQTPRRALRPPGDPSRCADVGVAPSGHFVEPSGRGRGDLDHRVTGALPSVGESRRWPRLALRASGACRRTIVRAVPCGMRLGVARDTTAMTTKVVGSVQAAGWVSNAPAQPPCPCLKIVSRTATLARVPPTTSPAPAPEI